MQSEAFLKTIHTARIDLLDLAELVGGVATHLREAEDDAKRNHPGALLCLDDALNLVSTIELQASAISAKIAKLTEAA
jgi:hypothetical protein